MNLRIFFTPEFFDLVAENFFNGMHLTLNDGGIEYKMGLGLKLNSIHTSFDSLIIRSLADERIGNKGTTIELFRNGNMKFLFPVYHFGLNDVPDEYQNSVLIDYLLDRFSPFEHGTVFSSNKFKLEEYPTYDRKTSHFVENIKMVDGHQLALVLTYITKAYEVLLTNNGYDKNNLIGYKAKVSNVWQRMVFLDSEWLLDAIKKYNVSVAPKDDVEFPNFSSGKYLAINLSEYEGIDVCLEVFEAIGFPREKSFNFMEVLKTSIENLRNKI